MPSREALALADRWTGKHYESGDTTNLARDIDELRIADLEKLYATRENPDSYMVDEVENAIAALRAAQGKDGAE